MRAKVTFFLNIITQQLISVTKAWFQHVTSRFTNVKVSFHIFQLQLLKSLILIANQKRMDGNVVESELLELIMVISEKYYQAQRQKLLVQQVHFIDIM